MRRTCNPDKSVRIRHGAPTGKSSARFEHSTDNREAAGSTPASRTSFQCGQVNRCHAGLISHASGVQLASPQPIWGSRSTGGPLACTQQMRVRFPPLPPNSSSVTVAEWLRRQTVDLSTRVQFPPVTPVVWAVELRAPLPLVAAQNRRTATHRAATKGSGCSSICGRSSVGLERGFPKPEAAGSIPAAHTRFFYIRGLGKRINPLGLGPRDSRFESEVPDQSFVG
jgi:hypothetical protein